MSGIDYLKENKYKGIIKRSVWLSEAGVNSRGYSDEELQKQAAGVAYASAATEISICLLFSFNSRMTGCISHGLTARMTMSAPVAASALLFVVWDTCRRLLSFW